MELDNHNLDASGAPQDIAFGKYWIDKIEGIEAQLSQVSQDTAFIRGKLEGKEQNDERNFTWKHGAGMTLLAGLISFVAAKLT